MRATPEPEVSPENRLNRLIGDNVRVFREGNGLTQRELAEKLSQLGWRVDNTAVARIEAGTREMRAGQLALVAQALGRAPGELYEADRTSQASMELLRLMQKQAGMQASVVELLEAKDRLVAAMASIEDAWESQEYADRLIAASPAKIVGAIEDQFRQDRSSTGVRTFSGALRDSRTYSGNELRSELTRYLGE